MKKLNITKERFEKSRYFTKKYGKLEYVSESGKLFKTNKGKVLMFKESDGKFSEPCCVCPYCGGTRCSLEDADPLNFYDLDSFEGKTVNVRFGCYDCNKLYNVTFELRTKDVYPADEM